MESKTRIKMENDKRIDVLNSLIIINNDRIEGYTTAAKETEAHYLKTLFGRFISTSQKCRQDLITEVHKLGGEEAEGTKISGKLFRVWMVVKAALTGKDRTEILNSCEFGEDEAQDAYVKALEQYREYLSEEHRNMINEQKSLLKAEYDYVKALRDALIEADDYYPSGRETPL